MRIVNYNRHYSNLGKKHKLNQIEQWTFHTEDLHKTRYDWPRLTKCCFSFTVHCCSVAHCGARHDHALAPLALLFIPTWGIFTEPSDFHSPQAMRISFMPMFTQTCSHYSLIRMHLCIVKRSIKSINYTLCLISNFFLKIKKNFLD